MAVLLRSVNNDGKPIVDALRAVNIPVLVGGVSALFDTPEVQAVRDAFYYLADHTPRMSPAPILASLEQQFGQPYWGITEQCLHRGLELLEERKSRIGQEMDAELYLQRVYHDLLTTFEIREENVY